MKYSKELLDRAMGGDVAAQCELAECYKFGSGTVKDPRKAAEYWQMAADRNSSYAQFELAVCYKSGSGVDIDMQKAAHYFSLSAKQDNVSALKELATLKKEGLGMLPDPVGAVQCLQKAAAQGDTVAQYRLAKCYENGEGVEPNYSIAVEMYTKAAEASNADAQFALANCYEQGLGTTKNAKKAVELYRKAADTGNPNAQLSLARCYLLGNGIAKNEKTAAEWFKRTSNNSLASSYTVAKAYQGYLDATTAGKKAKPLVPKSIKKLAEDIKMYYAEKTIADKEVEALETLIKEEPTEPILQQVQRPLPRVKEEYSKAKYKKDKKASYIASVVFGILFALTFLSGLALLIGNFAVASVREVFSGILPGLGIGFLLLLAIITMASGFLPILIIIIANVVSIGNYKKAIIKRNEEVERYNKSSLEEYYNNVRLAQEDYETKKAEFPELKAAHIEKVKLQTKSMYTATQKINAAEEALRACRIMKYEYIDPHTQYYTPHHPAIEINGYLESKRATTIKQAISLFETENKEAREKLA